MSFAKVNKGKFGSRSPKSKKAAGALASKRLQEFGFFFDLLGELSEIQRLFGAGNKMLLDKKHWNYAGPIHAPRRLGLEIAENDNFKQMAAGFSWLSAVMMVSGDDIVELIKKLAHFDLIAEKRHVPPRKRKKLLSQFQKDYRKFLYKYLNKGVKGRAASGRPRLFSAFAIAVRRQFVKRWGKSAA